jgi:hypothetical protein
MFLGWEHTSSPHVFRGRAHEFPHVCRGRAHEFPHGFRGRAHEFPYVFRGRAHEFPHVLGGDHTSSPHVLSGSAHEFPHPMFWEDLYCSIFRFLCNILYIIDCPFSFSHCIVCPSIYDFWLSFWYLQCFWTDSKSIRYSFPFKLISSKTIDCCW